MPSKVVWMQMTQIPDIRQREQSFPPVTFNSTTAKTKLPVRHALNDIEKKIVVQSLIDPP
ncbi:MAG: hypothetical protein CRU78_13405 [Candidatus Accumulibacter phosphatis]|uniref:Uncharacterized protein n=1 Tax=Candidatus Accumulibacter phosphatis TaxID=327160 RepID=A0A6A7RV85_9PROT|nr:hypothetical protein [Candidatus Accumulibacter phosphatis]